MPGRTGHNYVERFQGTYMKTLEETTDEKCENCGKNMVKKWGRNGWFLACPGYPECKFTKNIGEDEVEETDEVCEKCGSPMAIRSGRTGRFLSCSAYPKCKNIRPLSTGIQCLKDGCSGYVVERRSKKGRTFYGCSEYPKCDFVSWNLPVKEPCPICKHPYLVIKTTQRDGTVKQCPEKTCKFKEPVEEIAAG